MKKIGITGSIASGKSTVCHYLVERGYTVIDADQVARWVVEQNMEDIVSQLVTYFGKDILDASGNLQRSVLAGKVFGDAKKLAKLNEMMHPVIFRAIDQLLVQQQSNEIVFIEMALLFESNYDQKVDEVWVVVADKQTQLERLMKRNKVSKEEALKRIDGQWSNEKKEILATRVIDNSNSVQETFLQIDHLLESIKVE